MKKKFKFLIGASVLVASSAVLAPLLTSCKNQTTSSSSTDDNIEFPVDNKFVDNTQSYSSIINNPTSTSFNVENDTDNWESFNVLSKNVNSHIYNKVFNNISENTIINDLYNMILTLGTKSKINVGFYANIKNVDVTKNNNNWLITLKFLIYNSLTKTNKYTIGNEIINVNSKSTKSINLEISGEIQRTFYNSWSGESNTKMFFGYYFPNAKLTIDNEEINLNSFKLNDYSPTLNKYIEFNNDEVGYTDIEDFANEKLMNFTEENMKNEIQKTYDLHINTIGNILGPLQKILQEIIKTKDNQKDLITFLSENSNYFANVINELYKFISKNNDIDLKSPISLFLSNKKLSELLVDENTKNLIVILFKNLLPNNSLDIKSILDNINSENVDEQINVILEVIKQLASELKLEINDDLSNILDQLKNDGFLSTILKNSNIFINIIKEINNSSKNRILTLLIQLFESYENGNQSNNIFNLIYNLVNIKNDDNNEYIFKELLSKIIPNSSILSILNQILFDNSNLTPDNIVNFIDVFANPKTSTKNGAIVSWEEWFNSIKKTPAFYKNEDDNIVFQYKFEFSQDIYLDIDTLCKILPNNLSIGTTTIPLGIIVGALPDWISINKGDYVEVKQEFNNIEYDVVLINGEYKLSWQAFTYTTVDVNLPNTLKTIYDTSLFGSSMVEILNNIFYGIHNINFYFKPYTSTLNTNSISNYNPKTKDNYAIFLKNINQERLLEIKQTFDDSIHTEIISDTEFMIAEGGWFSKKIVVNKNKTVANFDIYSLLSEYFNLENFNGNLHINLDVNTLINSSSILTVSTPKYISTNVAIQTPYYVYTDNDQFKNYFSINF